MESLTKEKFWNGLEEKYPKGMEVFKNWIDEYKKKVNWEHLFNYGFPCYAKQGWHNPKYHDLPIAMQIGIWIEFSFYIHDFMNWDNCQIDISLPMNWEQSIESTIRAIHVEINDREG